MLTAILLFIGMLIATEVGRRWGASRRKAEGENAMVGIAAVDSLVFAVLGLLLAFTFTAAASRFDERRSLIVQHTNAIGTAWLRVDLLPPADRAPIRALMLDWLDLAIAYPSHAVNDSELGARDLKRLGQLQNDIWRLAVTASQREGKPYAPQLLLPALNELFDLSTLRTSMLQMKMPALVLPTLFILALAGAVLAGYGMSRRPHRSWPHVLIFCGTIAFALYVIDDFADPRTGLIRIDNVDQIMIELRDSLKLGVADATSSTAPATPAP